MPALDRQGDVFVLDIGDTENRFHPDWVASVSALLDEVEQATGPRAQVLALPLVTVAALQGHTFAAGTMFSLSHDFRVMRADRGFWCLPEADLCLPFSVGMSALIQAQLTPQTAHEAMIAARRYGGHDALAVAIVDRTAAEHEVRQAATEIAATHTAKAGPTLGTIKARMYAPVLDALSAKENPLG